MAESLSEVWYFLAIAAFCALVVLILHLEEKRAIRHYQERQRHEASFTLEDWSYTDADQQRLRDLDPQIADFDCTAERFAILEIRERYESPTIKCPRCGHLLVAKEGRRGRFIGCSVWPECNYSRSIK